jgi:hypothetical protein
MNNFNVTDLNNYMFYNDNIIKYNKNYKLKNNNIKNNNINKYLEKEKEKEKEKNNFFKPTEKDKLFWCFFIIVSDFNHYLLNKNNLFKIEKNFKIDIISRIRKIKTELKKNKIKINEIENDLLSDKNVSLTIIYVFSIIYKKSLIIVNNNIYYYFNNNSDNIYIIYNINNDYVLDLEKNNQDDINNIKNTKLLLDYNKPIKPFSFYKLNDLQEIAEKLKINIINNNKKKTKKVLYEEILNKI